MKKLPYQLQILNNFIYEKPHIVVRILKENGIKVSNRPTLPEIINLSVQAIANDNKEFVEDVYKAIETGDESNFDPITLGVSAVLSIGSAIFGSKQAEKQRQAMFNAKLMELESTERLTREQIQAMKETERLKILSNTLTDYALGLQGESTKRQRDTALFVGIMGVGLAVMYATIQLFKT